MNKYKNNKTIEYLSLILVLSFLFIKNIYIVFIGIIIALYQLNQNFLDKLIIKHPVEKAKKLDVVIEKTISEKNDKKYSYNESEILSLVETIEETGFIPSSINKKENHAA